MKYLLLAMMLLSHGAFAALIFPTNITIVSGTTTGTLASTNVQDQSGSVDEPAKYLSLNPNASNVSTTKYDFTVPGGAIDKLVLKVNFKGKPKTAQAWRIQAWDILGLVWTNIGDNTGVTDAVWSPITGQILAADFAKYVNGSSILKMRIITTTPLLSNAGKFDQFAFDVVTTPIGTTWWEPTPGTSYQIQYAGTLNTSLNVAAYNIDMVDTSQANINTIKSTGRKVICYFSAGSWENWRPDQASFPESVKGNTMSGWPDEKWLDVRQLSILMPIMEARMDTAVSKGCDAVDPDNMDGYAPGNATGFPLTRAHQLAYYTAIADAAHARGLAVSLKNAMGLLPDALTLMDFAVNEQCYEFNECSTLTPVINANKPVFHMEYNRTTTQFCSSVNALNFDSLKKNLSLDAARTACR